MKFLQQVILIFGIACSVILSPSFLRIETSAQTTVCNGESVALILNGYKHGSTLWQQSSDRTTWSIAQGTNYNDSLVFTADYYTTYYYRAIVTDGTCSPFYSDTVLVPVRPAPVPPTAKPASGIAFISFNANWSVVDGATTYYLDVANDAGFTSFVSGYNNIKVNDTTYAVTKVLCDTTYYYRVRVYDDTCGLTSSNSNAITVKTPLCPTECTYKSTCNGNISDTRDNKIYKTVQIGRQCWMAQNLNVGTAIPVEVNQTPGIIEKYCYGYDHTNSDSSKCATYGGLYQWDHMMAYGLSVGGDGKGPQGICATGWHIPTHNEWICLENTVGTATAGGELKDTSSLWISPNKGATNGSGFTALPGGQVVFATMTFGNSGNTTFFWTATESSMVAAAWFRSLSSGSAVMSRNSNAGNEHDGWGFSVRCVKD